MQKKPTVPPKSKPGTKTFDFTKLFKCGSCGSGITAQDKFKRYKNGVLKKYIYYHCTQFNNFDCPEPYLREEKLVEQLSRLLQNVPVEEIANKALLKPELDKFMVIKLAIQAPTYGETSPQVDMTDFIKYVFQDGTRAQKRELISCLNSTLYLENRVVTVKETTNE